ncbi:MAG: F0F1 ATP synthase subunit epsilon [Phycisphaerales bacterium]|nr:F0F1 ATP synthase subunit epsilon [Phycisphaerales bacterium]
MAQKTFHCQLVTPTEKLVDGEMTYASVPAWDGLFGVLPGRAPLLARLGLGELMLHHANTNGIPGGDRSFLIDGGFVKMADNGLTILAERAVAAESISLKDAEAELAEAEARRVPEDAPDLAARQSAVRRDRERALLKVRMARAVQGRGI